MGVTREVVDEVVKERMKLLIKTYIWAPSHNKKDNKYGAQIRFY